MRTFCIPSRAGGTTPLPSARSTNDYGVTSIRRTPRGPPALLGLAVLPVGVALIRWKMSTEIGGKCITLYVSADHRRFRSKLHVWNTWRWCSGWRQGQAAVRVGDVKAWLRCPWAVAGPGRASRRRAERSSRRGRLAGGPPPTGTQSSPADTATRPTGQTTLSGRLAGGPPPTGTSSSPAHIKQPGTHSGRSLLRPEHDHPQPMFHVKHLPNHRPRYPVWPGKWHT